MTARVHQINVNPDGGVPKHRVEGARISTDGMVGDKQRNLKVHGGPMRAVCLYSLEVIEALHNEGHPISAGSTGENLTITGLEWSSVGPGSRLKVGNEVILEITAYTAPCQQIAGSFSDGDSKRISEKLYPGWSRLYARVVREGEVRGGDSITLNPAGG